MKQLLQRIIKALAYLAAAVVILLAVAVGLFRLLLPRLPEYQEEIKSWATANIGLRVDFSGMNARWRLSGPELSFLDADLSLPDAPTSLLSANEVSIGVSLMRLLGDRQLVVDRIEVRDTKLAVQQDDNGAWLVQGMPLDQLTGLRQASQKTASIVIVAEDIEVEYQHPETGQLLNFAVERLQLRRDQLQTAVDADVNLPRGFGNRLDISAVQRLDDALGTWQLYFEGDALDLTAWSTLQPEGLPVISSGAVDFSLWMDWSVDGVRSATVDFVVSGLAVEDATAGAPFGSQGRVEFSDDPGGWLVAGSKFRLMTTAGDWPQSDWQFQANTGESGEFEGVTASASYLKLDDLQFIAAWLSDDQRDLLAQYAPSGTLRSLRFSVANLTADTPRFDVSAIAEDAGIAAQDDWPGVRGFSGSVRADSAGGRLEIDSVAMQLDLAAFLADTIELDDVLGTVIWRRNDEGTIVLSDSISIRNTDFDSQSSLQISIPADGGSPIVDLDSNWSVNDIGVVDRYLPVKQIKPALYRWLTAALVEGRIPRGTTRFAGPLHSFPFDGGEGVFRIDARVEDAVLQYSDKWPAAANMDLDLVVENMRLYSIRNMAVSAGNTVHDARIEIPDLRQPVLSIDAFATGSLESIRDFAQQSPIAEIFGGSLSRVEVDGDASFNLHLTYPILDRLNYEFTTRIQSSDGTIRFEGFAPPLSQLNGVVTITRDDIGAESLFGTFLGAPVDIDLRRTGDELPNYSVVATASGRVSSTGLTEELGAPLEGLIDGVADYRASIRFPKGNLEQPVPLHIQIESDLRGLQVNLPAPFAKPAYADLPLALNIEFPGSGRIESSGSLSEELKWTLGFEYAEEGWDFDRGVLAVGGDYPGTPEIRGLLIEGQVERLRLQDWLDLARNGRDGATSEATGVVDRIRSIDLNVDKLLVVGQQLTGHRVLVNRGGLDWVVQIDGEQAKGTVTIPYDFAGDRPLVLEMQTLALPGSEEESADSDRLADPRILPAIIVEAEEFSLGERHFGKVAAQFLRTPNGLEATDLRTEEDSFSVTGSAGWVIDPGDPAGQRSYIRVKLLSTDIDQTMQRLNYQPGIVGKDMELELDVSWSGGPRQDFMASLDGAVGVRFGAGQLNEVEPGAGRVFGLMSVVALPRRLSLDFSDVFDKGFGFDEITGSFRLVDGEAYTCDLSLNGPAADVGIVGRASLVDRSYEQSAVVSANVGNTLPIVGAVVAGPQVAAALLIFSQILKKPLQEMGQIFYAIDGSWDEPQIEVATALRFAESSGLAGCIEEAQ